MIAWKWGSPWGAWTFLPNDSDTWAFTLCSCWDISRGGILRVCAIVSGWADGFTNPRNESGHQDNPHSVFHLCLSYLFHQWHLVWDTITSSTSCSCLSSRSDQPYPRAHHPQYFSDVWPSKRLVWIQKTSFDHWKRSLDGSSWCITLTLIWSGWVCWKKVSGHWAPVITRRSQENHQEEASEWCILSTAGSDLRAGIRYHTSCYESWHQVSVLDASIRGSSGEYWYSACRWYASGGDSEFSHDALVKDHQTSVWHITWSSCSYAHISNIACVYLFNKETDTWITLVCAASSREKWQTVSYLQASFDVYWCRIPERSYSEEKPANGWATF